MLVFLSTRKLGSFSVWAQPKSGAHTQYDPKQWMFCIRDWFERTDVQIDQISKQQSSLLSKQL